MAKKTRFSDDYQLPPHVRRAQRLAAESRAWAPRASAPRPGQILGILGLSVLCTGLSVAFWLPPRSLVQDLRNHGVTTTAQVTAVDDKPKYVKVEFTQGPESGNEVKLWDYAGMLPDVDPGDAVLVTYDPDNPHRSLPRSWVADPPVNLPAYGSSAIALFLFSGAVIGIVRRRRILGTSTAVRLTKP